MLFAYSVAVWSAVCPYIVVDLTLAPSHNLARDGFRNPSFSETRGEDNTTMTVECGMMSSMYVLRRRIGCSTFALSPLPRGSAWRFVLRSNGRCVCLACYPVVHTTRYCCCCAIRSVGMSDVSVCVLVLLLSTRRHSEHPFSTAVFYR